MTSDGLIGDINVPFTQLADVLIIYYKVNGFGQYYKCQDYFIFIELRKISVSSCIFRKNVVIFQDIPAYSAWREILDTHA
jgi:hypothetical protein